MIEGFGVAPDMSLRGLEVVLRLSFCNGEHRFIHSKWVFHNPWVSTPVKVLSESWWEQPNPEV